MIAEHDEPNKFHDGFDAFDSNAYLVMAEHYEWKKFYDAFDPFDSNAHLVLEKHYESNKFYDAFDAFDLNVHLVMAEHQEPNKFHDAFNAFGSNARLLMPRVPRESYPLQTNLPVLCSNFDLCIPVSSVYVALCFSFIYKRVQGVYLRRLSGNVKELININTENGV